MSAYRGPGLLSRNAWLLKWVVGLGLVAGGAFAAQRIWSRAVCFRIRGILVDPPVGFIRSADLPVKKGDHLFGFSAVKVEEYLLSRYPQLLSVGVSRTWGGMVEVHAVVRQPLGKMAVGGREFGVDRSGSVFALDGLSQQLPELDAGAAHDPRLLSALDHLHKTHPRWVDQLTQVHRTEFGLIDFMMKDKTDILWGPVDPASVDLKARRLERVLSDSSLSPRGYVYLKFIDTDRIVAKRRR